MRAYKSTVAIHFNDGEVEDNIFVSFPYVFAAAEDGHTNVFMLFSFEVELDGGIVWELVAYDVGGIYCHGSKIKKVP